MSWVCNHAGTSEEGMDPMVNYGQECVVCGKTEGQGSGGAGSGGNGGGGLPVAAIAAGIGLVLLLGGGFLLSPSLPGVCSALSNCKSWQDDFDEAVAKGDEAIGQLEGADSATLETLKKDLDDAIGLLEGIPEKAETYDEATTKLEEYRTEVKGLDSIVYEQQWRDYFDANVTQGEDLVKKLETADAADQEALSKELQTIVDNLGQIPEDLSFHAEALETQEQFKTALGSSPDPSPSPSSTSTTTVTPKPAPSLQAQPRPTPYNPPPTPYNPPPTPYRPPQTPYNPPPPTPYNPPPPTPAEPYIPPVPSETQMPVPGF